MAYATHTDVSVRWGRTLTTEEISLVSVRLEDIERTILRRIPDLAARILAGTVLEADVIQVEADAVLRVVRNPDGYASETDGSYTYVLSDDAATARLELTPGEWELLGETARGFFMIVPRYAMPT